MVNSPRLPLRTISVNCRSIGRLAQLVRAPCSHRGGHRFEPCAAHSFVTLAGSRGPGPAYLYAQPPGRGCFPALAAASASLTSVSIASCRSFSDGAPASCRRTVPLVVDPEQGRIAFDPPGGGDRTALAVGPATPGDGAALDQVAENLLGVGIYAEQGATSQARSTARHSAATRSLWSRNSISIDPAQTITSPMSRTFSIPSMACWC